MVMDIRKLRMRMRKQYFIKGVMKRKIEKKIWTRLKQSLLKEGENE